LEKETKALRKENGTLQDYINVSEEKFETMAYKARVERNSGENKRS